MYGTDEQMDAADAWVLRGAVVFYGFYAAYHLGVGLSRKLSKAGMRGAPAMLRRYANFLLLSTLGLYCIIVFCLRTVIVRDWGTLRVWCCMLSCGHAVYCTTENQISFSRMPLILLSARNQRALVAVIRISTLVACIRFGVNLANIATIVSFPTPLNAKAQHPYPGLDTAAIIVSVTGAAVFMITEFYVYLLTRQISRGAQKLKTAETMVLLANANMAGSLAAVVDIVEQYEHMMATETLVLCLGLAAFVSYGKLLSIDTSSSSTPGETPRLDMTATANIDHAEKPRGQTCISDIRLATARLSA